MKIKSNKINDIRQFYLNELTEIYSPEESTVFMDMIFKDFSGITRFERIQNPDIRVTESDLLKIHFAVKELKNHKPIQYILKKTEFYGLPFYVDENVLIPRPETEELVEWVIEKINATDEKSTVLDIGTGSGCIAVSIKKHRPLSGLFAIDISPETLAVAKKNAAINAVEIHFLLHDILNENKPESLPHFDLIVSNPPYVRNSEKVFMKKNVLGYEPSIALYVDDKDPLKFYKAIAGFSIKYLKRGGFLFFEINENLGYETATLLQSAGFQDIITKKDINGKDRMICAVKS